MEPSTSNEILSRVLEKCPSYKSPRSKEMLARYARKVLALGTDTISLSQARELVYSSKGEYVDSRYFYMKAAAQALGVTIPKRQELMVKDNSYHVKEEVKDLHVISRPEMEALWEIAKDPEKWLLLMLVTTGFRASAIAQAQLNAQGDIETIEKGNVRKTSKAHPQLVALWPHRPALKSGESVYYRIKKLAQRAGLADHKNIHPHAFRHSFARMCLNQGNSLEVVQKLLGHHSSRITEEYYAKEKLIDVQERSDLPWITHKQSELSFPSFC